MLFCYCNSDTNWQKNKMFSDLHTLHPVPYWQFSRFTIDFFYYWRIAILYGKCQFTFTYFLVPVYKLWYRKWSFIPFFSYRPRKIICVRFRELDAVPIAARNTRSHHQQPQFYVHVAVQGPTERLTNYRVYYRTLD